MIGRKLLHYKIEGKLGTGGMGDVYRAHDTRLAREVALKVLPEEMASDPERLRRFEREARAVAALTHPNIVTIYSVEQIEGLHLITMELIEGTTIDQIGSSGRLPLEQFMEVAIPVVDALCAAHEKGITHRDLKPANIMINGDGRVKILDFGLAKLQPNAVAGDGEMEPTQALTQAGAVMGTVPYMSPEQVRGVSVDHRSDLFSVGVIFYRLLTGKHPFKGETSAELISGILRDTPDSVTDLQLELPNHLGRVINRCLQKEPSRRYQTARDLLNELEETRKEGVETTQKAAASIAVLPFADMSPQKDQDYFCEGIAEELINGLGRIKDLRVASRTSAFQFKDANADIREIGDQLSVSTILEGSVRKAGDRLRITAQLVNVADGYRLWSDRYDREMKDVFAIQDEIAENIVDALEVTLSPKERRAIQNVATRDVEAYDYYLRGRKFFYQMDRKSFEFAREMYSRAIELDPTYALVYAGIADCCSFLFMYAESSDQNREIADENSRKALELDSELAEAHASRGLALSLSKDYEAAEREFEIAIENNPKLFEAYYFYARGCVAQGNLERAAEMFEKASEARPEDYQAPLLASSVYRGLGQVEKSLATQRKGLQIVERHLELNPDDARALYLGANALIELGEREKGLDWGRRAKAIDPDEPAILYNVACVLSGAGELEEAIETLEQAVAAGFGYKAWLEHDSDFEPLRASERFKALVDSMPD
jgi:non-specific serine/threonine protein kinase